MLILNIAPIFKARGIDKPYTFMVKNGLPSYTAHHLLSGGPRAIRFDHIEFLCRILLCEPNDLFYWRPKEGEKLPPTHPLHKLSQPLLPADWQETLAAMPLQQLKEITTNMVKQSGK